MTQKTNPAAPSPFGGAPAARPAGGAAAPPRPNLPPSPPKPAAPPARPSFNPGSLGSRFGPARTTWEIWPYSGTLVRFSLEGLGGSLTRLLGSDLFAESGTYDLTLQALEKNQEALRALTTGLETAWEGYQLAGAMLVFPWMQDTRHIILAHARASSMRPACLRALDPTLVLNVLARTRSNLLQPRAPLAYDRSYLERSLISYDARLVRLVHVGGYFEEIIPDEQKPEEDAEE